MDMPIGTMVHAVSSDDTLRKSLRLPGRRIAGTRDRSETLALGLRTIDQHRGETRRSTAEPYPRSPIGAIAPDAPNTQLPCVH
jgi:hypothetical protein